jgi:hypothetical protein
MVKDVTFVSFLMSLLELLYKSSNELHSSLVREGIGTFDNVWFCRGLMCLMLWDQPQSEGRPPVFKLYMALHRGMGF